MAAARPFERSSNKNRCYCSTGKDQHSKPVNAIIKYRVMQNCEIPPEVYYMENIWYFESYRYFKIILCYAMLTSSLDRTGGGDKKVHTERTKGHDGDRPRKNAAAASRGGWKPGGGRFLQVTLRSRKPNAKASRGAVGPASRDRGCRTPESDRSGGKKGGTTDAQLSVLLEDGAAAYFSGGVFLCAV